MDCEAVWRNTGTLRGAGSWGGRPCAADPHIKDRSGVDPSSRSLSPFVPGAHRSGPIRCHSIRCRNLINMSTSSRSTKVIFVAVAGEKKSLFTKTQTGGSASAPLCANTFRPTNSNRGFDGQNIGQPMRADLTCVSCYGLGGTKSSSLNIVVKLSPVQYCFCTTNEFVFLNNRKDKCTVITKTMLFN